MNDPVAGRDYYNATTKVEAVRYLKQYYQESALNKIPKFNILGMYHNKMRIELRKRGNDVEEREDYFK